MKKEEARILSIERTNLLMEYIGLFLSDSNKKARINIGYSKIDGKDMTVFDILVPAANFEKRNMNTEIPLQQCEVLNKQILDTILDTYLNVDTVKLSSFFTIRGTRRDFSGITIDGANNVKVELNFRMGNRSWLDLSNKYNKRLKEYEGKKEQSGKSKR